MLNFIYNLLILNIFIIYDDNINLTLTNMKIILISILLSVLTNLSYGYNITENEEKYSYEIININGVNYYKYTQYYETGELFIVGYFNMLGERCNDWVFYHKNGVKSNICEYSNDIKIGSWYNYNENGKLILIRSYKKGKRDGIWAQFNDNGNLIHQASYKKNKINGNSVKYNEGGVLILEVYKMGKLINGYSYKNNEFITYHN